MEIFKRLLPKKYRWMTNIIKNAEKEDRKNLIKGWRKRKRYYTNDGIEANLKDLARCANCPNMCRFDCPALQVSKKEPFSPAHKARVSYFIGMDHFPWTSADAIETMYACMACDACYQWCPMDISCGDLLIEMRAELEKRKLIPERLQKIDRRIKENGSIFDHTPFHEDLDFNHNDPNPEIFYYIGCMDLKYQPNAVKATMAILERLEIPYCTHLESRECCGGPVKKAGFHSTAIELSERNQNLIKQSGSDLVISNCPGCVNSLINYYEEFGNEVKKEIKHTIQFIWEKLENSELKFNIEVPKKVTYHDPCLLSRRDNNLRMVNKVRKILKKIPKLEIKDAYLHGDETQCCGMGGAYAVSNPKYSKQLHEDRLAQLRKHSPDSIISGCPTCEYAFQKAQENTKSYEEDIQDVIEIIADALGLVY